VNTKKNNSAKKSLKKKSPVKPKGNSLLAEWIILTMGIVLISVIRVRLINIPFERDEGEYAYIANLILKGLPVYNEAYTLKLPGTPLMYALFQILFGKSVEGIHIGYWLMSIGTVLLLFFSLKKLFNSIIALTTSLFFGFASISFTYLGNAAHAAQFVVFFTSMAILFFALYEEKRKWSAALFMGLAFGMSFLMKQQASFLLIFGGVMILLAEIFSKPFRIQKMISSGVIYSAGVLLPYVLVLLWLKVNGSFGNFWFYTFQYAREYVTEVSLQSASQSFMRSFSPMWSEYWPVWALAGAGLILIWVSDLTKMQKLFAFLFLLFGFLCICPGYFFRQHYFISWLPSVSLAASISLYEIARRISSKFSVKRLIPIIVSTIAIIAALAKNSNYYFNTDTKTLCKAIYGINPFLESPDISKYIKANTKDSDRILVLGSEPQMLVYADRLSAVPYIYTYPLVEKQKYNLQMQKDFMSRAEKANAPYAVFVRVNFSWLYSHDAPKDIMDWVNNYVFKNYSVVGLVEMHADRNADYFWNEEAAHRQPQTEEFIMILKRNPS